MTSRTQTFPLTCLGLDLGDRHLGPSPLAGLPGARAAHHQLVHPSPPELADRSFDSEWGRDVERRVSARVSAGLPPLSVVASTGLPLTEEYQRGIAAGILVAKPMFTSLTAHGVRLADGTEEPAEVILWATGFRASLDHLRPLHLREPGGGIGMDGTTVIKDPRVQLVGFGPSASTLGATRAGRAAAIKALAMLAARRPATADPRS